MLAWAKGHGLSANRRFGVSHDDPEITSEDKLRHDACIEVPSGFEPEDGIGLQDIAGGDYAVLTHVGPYERLHEAYAHLYGQWLPGSGREPRSAPPFELMHRMPTEVEPEALMTDVYLPLA